MPRSPSCLCGTCRKCRARIKAREAYQAKSVEERRQIVARRDAAKVRAADRARYRRDRDKRLELNRRWREANPGKANASRTADAKRNPHRRRAYKAVQRALKAGRLVKPNRCERCGGEGTLHAHHDDYDKPLEVAWLCVDCHGLEHRT